MGCSSSVVSPEGEINANDNDEKKVPLKDVDTNTDSKSQRKANGHANQTHQINNNVAQIKRSSIDRNANKIDPMNQTPVPKSVTFEVSFGGDAADGLLTAKKKRPPRLLALEPLDLPRLTTEQLVEKQRVADEKRERIKLKKINSSQKSSRRRRDILKAKEFGMQQQVEQEKNVHESLRHAEIKREQRLLEIKEKQRIREERAKRIRERAKKMQNPDDEVEVEKDEQFNAASDDSWLGNTEQHDQDENSEPLKKVGQPGLRNTVSASTVDSYDAAFMRQHVPHQDETQKRDIQKIMKDDDDFFGS